MLIIAKAYHYSVPNSSLLRPLRWTGAGLSAVRSTKSHTEKSLRDIYLDLRICSLGKLEGHLAEELKKRWEDFLWDFFFTRV
jgi:hypothetical protein